MIALLRPVIAATNRELRQRLLRTNLLGLDPGPFTTRAKDRVLQALADVLAEGYAELGGRLQLDLLELAEAEAAYSYAATRRVLPSVVALDPSLVSLELLRQLVLERPMQGGLVGEWFRKTGKRSLVRSILRVYRKELDRRIAAGILTGDPVDKVVRSIARIVHRVARRHLRAVVDTATKHATNTARQAFGEAHAGDGGVIDGIIHVSTFDINTTVEWCIPRAGKVWKLPGYKPLGHSLAYAPGAGRYHWGCRSVNTFRLKSWKELGIDADELGPGERASMDGAVPDDLSLLDFYRDREWTTAELVEMFGKRRAARIEAGTLTIVGALRQIGIAMPDLG